MENQLCHEPIHLDRLSRRHERARLSKRENRENGRRAIPSQTLLISDLSYLLNHPAVTYLRETDIGYKHGGQMHKATGKANIIFMDAHVEARSLRQTNGIIMEFKK
jgi:prepilin-type processing-associated H-X9-DG protein